MLTLKRNESVLNISVKPESTKEGLVIGIAPTVQRKKVKELGDIDRRIQKFAIVTRLQIKGMVQIFTGKISSKNIGGPIAIFKITDDTTKKVFWRF